LKYYSYIDNLNLTIEELINLSPYKLKEVIDEVNTLNIENKISIITGLEDSVSRSYHITIEQNIWLKDLFFKRIDQLKNQSDLYSNDCKTTIIRLLKNKVNYAIDYLNQIPTNNLDQNIKYIKNYHFYEVLNIYEADFKDLLIKLHDTITLFLATLNNQKNTLKYLKQKTTVKRKKPPTTIALDFIIP